MIFNFRSFLFLIGYGFCCFCTQQELKIKQSQSDIPHLMKTLNAGINKSTCGPVIRASIDEYGKITPIKALTYVDVLEGNIECLLAGYKNIVELTKESLEAFLCERLTNKALQVISIAKPLNMRMIPSNKLLPRPKTILIYSPKGKEYALLWIKWLATKEHENFYLRGLFYNYSPIDIQAFFENWNALNINNKADFLVQKKEALEWIKDNRNGIGEWIDVHKTDYAITQESIEKFCDRLLIKESLTLQIPANENKTQQKEKSEEIDLYD